MALSMWSCLSQQMMVSGLLLWSNWRFDLQIEVNYNVVHVVVPKFLISILAVLLFEICSYIFLIQGKSQSEIMLAKLWLEHFSFHLIMCCYRNYFLLCFRPSFSPYDVAYIIIMWSGKKTLGISAWWDIMRKRSIVISSFWVFLLKDIKSPHVLFVLHGGAFFACVYLTYRAPSWQVKSRSSQA